MKMAAFNLDHFGEDAKKCYRLGHTLACELAIKASTVKDDHAQFVRLVLLVSIYLFVIRYIWQFGCFDWRLFVVIHKIHTNGKKYRIYRYFFYYFILFYGWGCYFN
jgi:hypothetical protein